MRGGGHNVAGRASIDDGLMIDLSLMKGIHVAPELKTKYDPDNFLHTNVNIRPL